MKVNAAMMDASDLQIRNRGLEALNRLDAEAAAAQLRRCCGARRWLDAMLRRRPFADLDALLQGAETSADELSRDDWLEAFAHHPKIGDLQGLRQRFATTAGWSEGEQAAVGEADDQVLRELAAGNRAYEERFGFIFIVCASGKSAAEMLALLHERLPNDPAEEWRVAAEQQRRITRLRLDKLLLD